MSGPEAKVKRRISAILKEHNIWYDMPVPSGFGKATLDYICCVNGKFLGIEAKAPGKHATPRQVLTMRQIKDAGGEAVVIDGNYQLLEYVIEKLQNDAGDSQPQT